MEIGPTGRSLRHLIDIVEDFKERKAGLRSLTDSIDTTSPHGRMVFQIMGSLAEFERELTIERTRAGLAAARGQAGTEIYSGAGVEGCEACP